MFFGLWKHNSWLCAQNVWYEKVEVILRILGLCGWLQKIKTWKLLTKDQWNRLLSGGAILPTRCFSKISFKPLPWDATIPTPWHDSGHAKRHSVIGGEHRGARRGRFVTNHAWRAVTVIAIHSNKGDTTTKLNSSQQQPPPPLSPFL